MRLDKESYREAEGCLKNYNYTIYKILSVQATPNKITISASKMTGMPKAPYKISDTVYENYIKLQDDEELQRELKKYKAVQLALMKTKKECKEIFDIHYREKRNKFETMQQLALSERTYERRKSELIQAVHEELKFLKNCQKVGGNK